MRSELQERLDRATDNKRRKEKLASQLRLLRQSLVEASADCDRHSERLESEEADVKSLQGLTLANLLQTVLGRKDDLLVKEKQEVVAAVLKLEQAESVRDELKDEVDTIVAELDSLGDAELNYETLLQEKREHLETTSDPLAARLMEFDTHIQEQESICKETREAIAAGRRATDSLRAVRRTLDSAANWGTFDIMGGGAVASIIKHGKLDDAKTQVRRAQSDVRRFNTELGDIGRQINRHLDVGSLTSFVDVFMDNIFTDFAVQSKISDSRSACVDVMRRVDKLVAECKQSLKDNERRIKELAVEREEFIHAS